MTDHDIETRIVLQLLQMALTRGYIISVWDSEDWAVRKSTDMHQLSNAVMQTDMDVLVLSRMNDDGKRHRIGSITLVYGNGVDVVSDYTDREELENLVDDTLRHWS